MSGWRSKREAASANVRLGVEDVMQKHLARIKRRAGGAGNVTPGCDHGGCHSGYRKGVVGGKHKQRCGDGCHVTESVSIGG